MSYHVPSVVPRALSYTPHRHASLELFGLAGMPDRDAELASFHPLRICQLKVSVNYVIYALFLQRSGFYEVWDLRQITNAFLRT